MPATGRGRWFAGIEITPDDLLPRVDLPGSPASVVANDWYWGNTPPFVTPIPYAWVSPVARFRPDSPLNVATVNRKAGGSATGLNQASINAFTATEFAATIDTVLVADPNNLVQHVLGNYATQSSAVPRMRCPSLTINLIGVRELAGVAGLYRVLSRKLGDRIAVTGTPTGVNLWPEGTTSLVIEGIRHVISADDRYVIWNTAPVIGAAPGAAGPWFRLDNSLTNISADKLAF